MNQRRSGLRPEVTTKTHPQHASRVKQRPVSLPDGSGCDLQNGLISDTHRSSM